MLHIHPITSVDVFEFLIAQVQLHYPINSLFQAESMLYHKEYTGQRKNQKLSLKKGAVTFRNH